MSINEKGSILLCHIIVLFLLPLLIAFFVPEKQMNDSDAEEKAGSAIQGVEIKRYYELRLKALDEGQVIFTPANGHYRYGPSIIRYEDGSMDAWFSSPGNNSTEWDWITYRHSRDGINWALEKVVLKPTKGSKDACSVCDPGVIYFGGYYYLAYTSTDYAAGKGSNNSAFVARSKNPDGPFEKWNGKGWGGNPEPIIAYKGDPKGWGIGEVSFVIKDDDLFIYYTYFDEKGGYTSLMKADLEENWPLTMRDKGMVCGRTTNDSLDVVYAENLDVFLAFSVEDRMSESSKLVVYESVNGKDTFKKEDTTKKHIDDFAHNMGIAKDVNGHIDTREPILAGYAFGRNWGRWSTRFQYVKVDAY